MSANDDLKAALPAASAQQLIDLAANGAAIDQNPNIPAALAALSNPIDAVALLNSMAQLSAASPAAPAAAPAPVPAPAQSSALSASPVLAAVASILLVAALL
jgi:hypothetical protein